MEIVKNENCRKWKLQLWKMEAVENGICGKLKYGKLKLWKIEIVENGNCGKWKLWKIEIVENGN